MKNIRATCRSVDGDVFGPSGFVIDSVYEMLRTFTPLESTSSGHEDKITSAQQPQPASHDYMYMLQWICEIRDFVKSLVNSFNDWNFVY